ncbi:hypothetical protein J3F84DRAFT_390864 [Trichoderma pleuroticola]
MPSSIPLRLEVARRFYEPIFLQVALKKIRPQNDFMIYFKSMSLLLYVMSSLFNHLYKFFEIYSAFAIVIEKIYHIVNVFFWHCTFIRDFLS